MDALVLGIVFNVGGSPTLQFVIHNPGACRQIRFKILLGRERSRV